MSPSLPLAAASVPMPPWSAAPFVLLLAAIAILPLIAPRWWERPWNKAAVVLALALPFAAWLVVERGEAGARELLHSMHDYASFIVLIGSLFFIAGGIHIRGSLSGTPLSNTTFLAIGAILANLIGTTGASMVLIRPYLRANENRTRKAHLVVFFIFVVSNCGGLLTPLGDPPLFLGFLKGVPFDWTLRLWLPWLVVVGALLIVFKFVDEWILEREETSTSSPLPGRVLEHRPIRIEGLHNLAFLAGVVAVMVAKGQGWGAADGTWPFGLQEGAMAGLAGAATAVTRPEIRRANRFGSMPFVEVAIVFLGIFVTMTAPLHLLNVHGGALGLERPWHYFWATGLLSSVLDNAPTYLAFSASAAGRYGVGVDAPHYLADLLARGPEAAVVLGAISCGAVMMGAVSYIGNGPNFMVKAIAEESGVKMPGFFGYMAWSAAILFPVFVLVSLIAFR